MSKKTSKSSFQLIKQEQNKAEFIRRAIFHHGEKYDYSKVQYVNSSTKVEVFCIACQKTFPVRPYSHAPKSEKKKGAGCRKCAGFGRTKADLLKAANMVYGEKYDLTDTIFVNSKTKFDVKCIKHDRIWSTTWHSFIIKQHGCVSCGHEKNKKPLSFYLDLFKSVHGDSYDYSLVKNFKGWHEKIDIICKVHPSEPFPQTPASHYYAGAGCKKCYIARAGDTLKFSTNDWVEKARVVHSNKYDYSLSEYKGDKQTIEVICPRHGSFFPRAGHHTQSGAGCKPCADERVAQLNAKPYQQFVEECHEIHLNKYTYPDEPEDFRGETILNIFCPIGDHGFFEKKATYHFFGSGCPKCLQSKGERDVQRFLSTIGLEFETQKKFSGCKLKRELPFDFFIPSLNLLIEYDGEQHYIPREEGIYAGKFELIRERDEVKNKFAKEAGFNLLRIRWDQNTIDVLKETITVLSSM